MRKKLRQKLEKFLLQAKQCLPSTGREAERKAEAEKSSFFAAILSGDWHSVNKALQKGIDVNCTDDDGQSGVHLAALAGHNDLVGTLINKGADLDKCDKAGLTPLMCAAQVGSEVIVDQLLGEEIDVKKKTSEGLTAVYYALYFGHTEIARKLEDKQSCIHQLDEQPIAGILEKAVKKNWIHVICFMRKRSCDGSYATKLSLASKAACCGHTQMLQYFNVNFNGKFTSDADSPLCCAIRSGFYDAVKYMLDNGCDVKQNTECIKVAIQAGNFEILELLREKEAPIFDRAEQNFTPAQLAVAHGPIEMLKYLVEQKCSLEGHEKMGELSLMAASFRQNDVLEFLKFLADKAVELDRPGLRTEETPLLAVSQKGPIQALEFLIDQKCNINVQNIRGVTPALRAAASKQEEILMLLGERGANLDTPDRLGETAILCAARNKSLSMVRFLADKKCRLDRKDSHGHTVAFYAVRENNVALLQFLLQRKVCLDEPDINGMTPLIIAVQNGAFDAIKLLTGQSKMCMVDHKDRFGKTALNYAVSKGELDIVKYLHEKGADLQTVDHDGNSLLLEALKATKNSLAILEFLTGQPECDIHAANSALETAVHLASMEKENDALMHLLEMRPAIDAQDQNGMTPFLISAAQGSESLVTVLKSVGADVNKRNFRGENAVHLAVKSGNLKIVQCLSLFDCVMDQEDSAGVTPLMLACSSNKFDMARFLIKKGADVNAVDHDGKTPAHFACQSGSLNLMKLLHDNAAKLNQPDLNGVVPVMLAAEKQDREFLMFLHNIKCSFSVTDCALKTVLHYAVQGKNEAAIRFLFDQGVGDPNALDDSGTSPVMLSVGLGCESILNILQSNHGRIDETVDHEDRTVAHLACQSGSLEILKKTQSANVRVSLRSRTKSRENCLTIACANGNEGIVKFLLEQGVHLNYKNSLGNNALIVAVKNGHVRLIPLLLEAGARASEVNLEGNNALLILCGKKCTSKLQNPESREHSNNQQKLMPPLEMYGNDVPDSSVKSDLQQGFVTRDAAIKALKDLIEAPGLDVKATNKDGKSALHFAAAGGSKEIIRFLLSKGLSEMIDLKDNDGETPLFSAIRFGNEKAAALLLDRGADALAENKLGLSVYSLAAALNSVKIMDILAAKEAQLSMGHVASVLKMEQIFEHMDIKHLDFLLDKGLHVDEKIDNEGATILHCAVRTWDIRLLRSLRKNSRCAFLADIVDKQDAQGNTAFHCALMTGRLDMAAELFAMNCRTDIRNSEGRTPLHVAVMKSKLSLVQWLFDHCKIAAQPEVAEPDSNLSALQLAAAIGNLSVFKFLLQKDFKEAATCSNKCNSAHYAAMHGNLNILKRIHETCPDCFRKLNAQGLTPFQLAVLNGHEEVANFLHQNAEDPALPDCIIHLAVQRGHQHIADWLVKRGAQLIADDEPTAKGTISWAVESGNFHLIQKVTSEMTDWKEHCDGHQRSLAQIAATFNHAHVLRFLRENNAPLDLADRDGNTPVLESASRGHLESLKLLQGYDCNIGHMSEKGRDIVHLASISADKKGQLNIVKFACEQGLPLDQADQQGNTALMYACRRGFKDVVEFLLSDGRADPKQANRQGRTPAHLAVLAGRSDILQLLQQHGASLDVTDSNGVTPLMVAVCRDCLVCVTLIAESAGLGDDSSRRLLAQLSSRASSDVRLEMQRRGLQLPEDSGGEPAIETELILQDIEMTLSTAEQSLPSQPSVPDSPNGEGGDAAGAGAEIGDDRSSYMGLFRCSKAKSAKDATVNDTRSTVNNDDGPADDLASQVPP